MNEHAVSTEPSGYVFTFSISRTWLRITGACAAVVAAVVAGLANAAEPFRAPLGISLGVLVITLLIAYVSKHSSRRKLETALTEGNGRHPVIGRAGGRKSLAAELSLLAELHMKGALSDEEFSAAKRRLLGSQ